MTSEIEAAGRRIIEVNRELECQYSVSDENDESICHCEDHESAEYIARALIRDERESDFRLVDEAFAEQMAISRRDLPWSVLTHWMIGGSLSIQKDHAVFRLAYNGHPLLTNPTIGDFYTACRLFRVTVTPTGAKEQ